jgi:hypothetical protein
MAVGGALQGIVIAGIYAGRFFAMAADRSKGSVLAQGGNTVILRMIKIIASYPAFLALIADFQINE